MHFPHLQLKRIVLNNIDHDDAEMLFELFSQPQVVAFYDLAAFTDQQQAYQLIELFASRYQQNSGIRWAIRDADTARLIGTCGFNSWSGKMHNAVIGYDLLPAYWHQGIAGEAVSAIIDFAFNGELPCGHIHRIQADTIPGNIASERLLLKLGFKEEGLRREAALIHGQYRDMKCFGLLSPEFRPQHQA